ncbi:MAG: type II toxin-antitoxin system prevent-host-death family antitoxin [Thermoleophilia bacterium]|nr:type II toxin-antitoxin system prevent-host-death family antitoxin [Thermoleophilia bacterium]
MEANARIPTEEHPDEVRVNVHEAKTHFSKLLERMEGGEDIVVCRAGVPVARLTPWADQRKLKAFGAMKGEPWLQEAIEIFDRELAGEVDEQILIDFYGPDHERTMPPLRDSGNDAS